MLAGTHRAHGSSLDAVGRSGASLAPEKRDEKMLFAIAVVLVVMWGLGFLAFHVTTGVIHLLLLVALIAIVFQLVSRRTA